MRNGWEVRKLKDVTTKIGSGATPKGGQSSYIESGISLIRSMNVYDQGFVENKLAFINDEQATKLNNVEIQEGDVLLNITGASVARCCIVPKEYLPARVNQHVSIIRPKKNVLNEKFIHYSLISESSKSKLLGIGEQGSTRQAITKAQIESFNIAFPSSLKEQKQIVAILDKAFAKIDQAKANVEKNLENTKELFQSKLNEIFSQKGEGWEEKKLGDLAAFRNGLNYTKSSSGESIKIVGVGNFKKNFYVPLSDLDRVIMEGNLRDSDALRNGDILAVRSNGNPELIGRCMLAEGVNEKISHSGFTIRVRLTTESVYPSFLCYFLKSTKAKRQLIDSGTGISIKSLNQGSLASLLFSIPTTIEKQKKIVQELLDLSELVTKMKTTYEFKLTALEELKKSLLEKAFSGQLTTQEEVPL